MGLVDVGEACFSLAGCCLWDGDLPRACGSQMSARSLRDVPLNSGMRERERETFCTYFVLLNLSISLPDTHTHTYTEIPSGVLFKKPYSDT